MAQRGTGEHTASGYAVITPSDTVNFSVEGTDTVARAIFVGTAGDVALVPPDGGTAVVFPNVPVGFMPCQALRVDSTNTGASNMVALF